MIRTTHLEVLESDRPGGAIAVAEENAAIAADRDNPAVHPSGAVHTAKARKLAGAQTDECEIVRSRHGQAMPTGQ